MLVNAFWQDQFPIALWTVTFPSRTSMSLGLSDQLFSRLAPTPFYSIGPIACSCRDHLSNRHDSLNEISLSLGSLTDGPIQSLKMIYARGNTQNCICLFPKGLFSEDSRIKSRKSSVPISPILNILRYFSFPCSLIKPLRQPNVKFHSV
jgi:hypothetical protein